MKAVRWICTILSILIVVLMLAVAATLLVPFAFGYKPLAVLGESMEPKFPAGSVVFVKEDVDPADIGVGDYITFKIAGSEFPVTHEVIAVDREEMRFTAHGIALAEGRNDTVPYESVIGRAADVAVPLVGNISEHVRTTAGVVTAVIIVLVVILLAFLPDLLGRKPVAVEEAAAAEEALAGEDEEGPEKNESVDPMAADDAAAPPVQADEMPAQEPAAPEESRAGESAGQSENAE